ncbi:protein-PII uridylyltransferase [Piscirickettsia salmonis]|uniref:Bifunctional uridylyltransferase/uridylyl-removing enzyme n=1 Tax=Piscirickettsia salmonis TaxID=1238 RepID=A0A9Q5V9N6_PISSA|nr:[protein-PII] uridylyltransferase [Piscirickettsia salmonis]APS51914.1 protein-PII uridylyltransferase [Piscirickettsia salmonis]APS55132.1 protein-PII uridylyltransferase [Piscirickettsia salmonis]APS58259.1 protein-PII uridylyltransferase [Piscirickettsia salmonis]ERL63464.1 protein-P-II uridylyltransferase [Piscirickettsia salmonis LF-89 = ATCC VR-1361]PEQ16123.1 [protein-PII] uridylyltransferase [Piscirickettsia salmonis]
MDAMVWAQQTREKLITLNDKQKAILQQFPQRAYQLLRQRAKTIDRILNQAWPKLELARCTLIATGGYGRGTLYPYSDIDVLILTHKPIKRINQGNDHLSSLNLDPHHEQQNYQNAISVFLTQCWDAGLEIRHSVRTLAECLKDSSHDPVFFTSILETRYLNGDKALFTELQQKLHSLKVWSKQRFFEEKQRESAKRYQLFQNTVYNLEPDIKNSPGGLRDLDTLRWLLLHHFGDIHLIQLYKRKLVTRLEYRKLAQAQQFFAQIRLGLHLCTQHKENRLLFDHQPKLAEFLGYHGESSNDTVSMMMQNYFRHAAELRLLFIILMRQFEQSFTQVTSRSIGKTPFIKTGHYIGLAEHYSFKEQPKLILEIFLCLAKQDQLIDIDAKTSKALMESLALIDEGYRNQPEHQRLFATLLQYPSQLRMMNRFGIIGAYLPIFSAIIGQMQYSLFHSYTVDTHTLFVMQNIEKFCRSQKNQDQSHTQHLKHYESVSHTLEDPAIIYTAAFFHDIAKGRDGQHSEEGAIDANAFCQAHSYTPYQTRLVNWLVLHHLLMSQTAQTKDIQDPHVINEFAHKIRDLTHLNYLYVLTVADIQGTNPKLWNSWREALLKNLYLATKDALKRGSDTDHLVIEHMQENQADALALLNMNIFSSGQVLDLWQYWHNDYFIKNSAQTIAYQTTLVLVLAPTKLPIIDFQHSEQPKITQVFIYCQDSAHLFTRIVNALDRLNISVNEAALSTTLNGYSLHHYVIFEQDNTPPEGTIRLNEIKQQLSTAIANQHLPSFVKRRPNARLSHFHVPTQVSFQNTLSKMTALKLITRNQPSLLAYIGLTLSQHNLIIHNAKISTFGERVEDTLYITDQERQPIDDQSLLNKIAQSLCYHFDKIQESP